MKLNSLYAYAAPLCMLAGQAAGAITLDLNSPDSIKRAASTIAYDLMTYYTGNRTGDVPGNLPDPYYWWEAGAMFGTMINYWYLTGDTTYNEATTQALLHQVGDENDYMPTNQTKTEGNDDQGFWAMAVMLAAEVNFPNPPKDKPQWLALAQAVFNTQAGRWDTANCNGGLRWQIFTFNAGYNYKNSISNGCFFNLAARLALYTGNKTYADWAERTWNWVETVGLMTPELNVYDGTGVVDNCTTKDRNRWSYNHGIYLNGAAALYKYTNGSEVWKQRVSTMVNSSSIFFENGVMYEFCEPSGKCNVDQRSFKAYLSRWMAWTTKLAPFTRDAIMEKLSTSAAAAVKTCTGGASGNQCGVRWTTQQFDGSAGVGEQMSALEVVQANLIDSVKESVTADTGGTSKGNPSAGGTHTDTQSLNTSPVTTGDRIGAGIVTAILVSGVIGGCAVMAF
ncbi:glycoside hydrolase family 76 protein [Xylogone sp. PMI_703]|nr:glycoside hydrolase family 76 protein [Xylogone sp. PMI_703]